MISSTESSSRLHSVPRKGLLIALFCSAASASLQAVTLAQWSFNGGTAADLTSGGFTLTSANSGTVVYSPGYVSLSRSAELISTGINSTTYAGLTSAVSLLVTMRFDGAPENASLAFTSGLLKQTNAASPQAWGGQTFVVRGSSTEKFGAYANPPDQYFSGTNTTRPIGSWFTVALTFNAGTVKGYLDGTQLFSTAMNGGATTLSSFGSFGVGRIFNGAVGVAASYADIQVHDVALNASEVASLSAASLATTAVPEPSSFATLAGLAALSVGFTLRRRGHSGRRVG